MAGSGNDTQVSTSSSAPSNPNVNTTVDKVLGGVNTALDKGPAVFDEDLYAGAGDATKNSWQSALSAAGNPGFASAINGATGYAGDLIKSGGLTPEMQAIDKQYGDLSHAYDQNAPGYDTLRSTLLNDTLSAVNKSYNNSGRLGGGSNIKTATDEGFNALAGLDYSNFQNGITNKYNALQGQMGVQQQGVSNAFGAASALPNIFQSSLMPSQVQGQVGAAQDADAQAALLARNDLFRRKNDAQRELVGWGGSVLAGPASASGTTTTNTEPGTPWWQSALGLGIGAAGAFL